MRKVFSLVLCVCICMDSFAARAQDISGTSVAAILDVKPVPSYEMPLAEFEAKTKLFQDKPGEDTSLSYAVRIPSNWQQVKAEDYSSVVPSSSPSSSSDSHSQDSQDSQPSQPSPPKKMEIPGTVLLGDIARFYGPSLLDSQSRFSIQSSELKHDITAKNWLANYVLHNGYTLQFMTEISETKAEAVYFQLEGDTAYISRVVAEINGPRMVLAVYSVPESRFQEEKVMQYNVLKSFHFLDPQEAKVENRKTYSFLNLLRFDYPETWRLLAPNIYSIDSMDAKIINSPDEAVLNGEIDIHVVSTELDTTLAEEIKVVQESVKKRGLIIGKMIEEPHKYKFSDPIYFSRIEVYKATDTEGKLIDHEYWICVLMEDRYFYIVTMLTPARTIDFYNWATNTEAFQTVVETLRP